MSQLAERLAAALGDRYRIERELGAGGMATVYLAADLKHERRVAIKVLKPELAAVLGAERFVQEIKTTAALSHPNILPLFDSGEAGGNLYYVMPYLEGETIREKLNRETQCGIEEAVKITAEVAEALAYAHQHGVIHRDIKPENILLHAGRPMVMDFGIALAVSAAAGGRMTETGLSLGTPHYMSPEQATADKDITARSDIYSLASVLYEMLTGEPPHTGATAQAIIMKIVTDVARPVTDLRRNVPANVAAAVAKALEKLPADRFQTAKDFAVALGAAHFTYGTMAGAAVRRPALARRTFAAAAGLTLGGIAFGVWGWQRGRASSDAPVVPLTLELPNARPDIARFAVSPDGARYAFATDEGIVVRDSAQREYRVLAGSNDGESPSFAPDGQWLVFHVRGHLRKIPIAGGAAVAVIPNDSLLAGRVRWGQDGSIVFESGNQVYVVSPGGTVRRLAKADRAESPRLTPDGAGVLYVDTRSGSRLMYYDLAADTAFLLVDGSSEGMYLPTGHVLYTAASGGLFAVRFDRKRHQVSGAPIPVVADIVPDGTIAAFDVTRNGTLVYRSGIESEYRVVVRDAGGRTDTLPIAPKIIAYVRASPDGRMLALTIGSARGTNRHTALYDLSLGTLTRFTQDGGGHSPVWSPDGRRLAFTADLPGGDAEDIFVQPVDRSTPPVRLFAMPNDQHASAWPVDTLLVFSSQAAPGGRLGATSNAGGGAPAAIGIANPVTPGAAPHPYLSAEWGQLDAAVSPDGRWAAYTSLETGTPEVFARPFPVAAAGGVVKLSSAGGQRARWSADGRTVYYQALDGRTTRAVHVTSGASITVGSTETVMTIPGLGTAWDLDRKTGRIYLTQSVGGDAARIVVTQRWLDDFRRHLVTKRRE